MAHSALRIGGLRRSQRLLGRRAGKSAAADPGLDAWRRRSQAIRRIGARLPGAHCLARALCLWCWMRRAGLAPDLRIGIRPSPQGRILSHAWVELDGEPVDETPGGIADCRIVDWPEQPFEP